MLHQIFQIFLASALAAAFVFTAAPAGNSVVGVNVVNPLRASLADQDAIIAQLKAAHVRVIRSPLTPDDKAIDFVKRVYAQGIKIEFQLSPQFPPTAPSRPYQPRAFPNMWGGHRYLPLPLNFPKSIFNL
jgi:hypothetical protein